MKWFLGLLASVCLAGNLLSADCVVVLLDTSGSMYTRLRGEKVTRLEAAQTALVNVLRQLPGQTQVGILNFDSWIYPLGPLDKNKAAEVVKHTVAGGGTPLGRYIKLASDALVEARKENHNIGTYRLLVVTDGEASDGSMLEKFLPDIASRGILLYTIGLDMSSDHSLKRASKKYMSADDPRSLENAMRAALAEVGKQGDTSADDFSFVSGLTDGGARAITESVTEVVNVPIGEPIPIKTVDENGNVTYVTPPADSEPDALFWILIILLVLLLFVIIFMVAVLNQ